MAAALLSTLLVAMCLALSFLLSGMEAGLFALSRLRVRQQMRAGRTSAAVLHRFLENPENFLWTILVGNTLVNFAALGWVVASLYSLFPGHFVIIGLLFAVAVFLFYALFDLLPKTLFRIFPNRLCMLSARPFQVVHFALRPLVALVEWVSRTLLHWTDGRVFSGHLFGNREELKRVMQESAYALSSEERAMVSRVLELQTLTLRQVATPMESAVTMNASQPVSDVLAIARERGLTRLPVWELREGRRRITGMISAEALLFQPTLDTTRSVGTSMKPALFLPEETRLEVALRRMQRSGERLAVVLGRDQREVGIVSLEDILKVVFGEVKL